MPTWAAGRSRRLSGFMNRSKMGGSMGRFPVFCSRFGQARQAPRPGTARGFTLVEILVVLIILSLLATTVSLSLPDMGRQDREAALEAWQRQAERTGLWAEARAATLAWQVSPREARILEVQEGEWVPSRESGGRPLPLPGGLNVTEVLVEGIARPLGERSALMVFSGSNAPVFVLTLAGTGERWRLAGGPTGRVSLERLGEAP